MNCAYPDSKSTLAAAHRRAFPPSVVVEVKAVACELPKVSGKPLSRFSMTEIRREVIERGLVAEISGATLWRWLDQDAIRPWRYRSWIFPRDPEFGQKAARILDLYQGRWENKPLGPKDFVVSADEKTSIQARFRCHPSTPPACGRAMRIEHEYQRRSALAYLAAWDVHRAKIFGRCTATTGIAPFDRLVKEVMSQEPYRSARRVFWITDNGSSHRGSAAAKRLKNAWPSIVLVHTPVHASWLNQVEIYFSIVQRKVLSPNDFQSVAEIEDRLLRFQEHYEQIAHPFQWTFTRQDLLKLMAKLRTYEDRGLAA
jgi:transposase